MAGVFLSAGLQLLFSCLAVCGFFVVVAFYDSFQQKGEKKTSFCRIILS